MADEALPVLLVDDQEAVIQALELLLDLHGLPHLAAGSPREARAVAARQPLGAVVQDMNFGGDETSGQEGIELFHALRELQPGLPILLITAWASLETAVELVRQGAADYLAKPWDDEKLVTSLKNLVRMRGLELENLRLRSQLARSREELAADYDLQGLVYASREMHRLVELALHVAGSDAPVLITGPSGSGKERLAEIIQANSRRRQAPFIRVNVGAIPEELMESELFGAEPGAYTGLRQRRIGHFESADGGTLFLDEIDALSLAGQVKLLRVLQSGELMRLGSSQTRRVDVRILSASNARLSEAIAEGRFREDLFFRLNVLELALPPLARRPDDLLPLARHFLARFAAEQEEEPRRLSPQAEGALLRHPWPGNVRELENRIQRATLVTAGPVLTPADLGLGEESRATDAGGTSGPALTGGEETERRQLLQALDEAGGVVARAAERLGVSRQALYRRMARLGVELERRPRLE